MTTEKEDERERYWKRLLSAENNEQLLVDCIFDEYVRVNASENPPEPTQYHAFSFYDDPTFTLLDVPLDALRILVKHEAKAWSQFRIRVASVRKSLSLYTPMSVVASARLWALEDSEAPWAKKLREQPTAELLRLALAGVNLFCTDTLFTPLPSQVIEHAARAPQLVRRVISDLQIDFARMCGQMGQHCALVQWLNAFAQLSSVDGEMLVWDLLDKILAGHAPHTGASYFLVHYLSTCFGKCGAHLYSKLLEHGHNPFELNGRDSAVEWLIDSFISDPTVQPSWRWNLLEHVLDASPSAQWRCIRLSKHDADEQCADCTAPPRPISVLEIMSCNRYVGSHMDMETRARIFRCVLQATTLEELNEQWEPECIKHSVPTAIHTFRGLPLKSSGLLTAIVRSTPNHPDTHQVIRILLEHGLEVTREVCQEARDRPIHFLCALFIDWCHGRILVRRSWPNMIKWLWVAHLKEKENPFYGLPRDLMRVVISFVHRSGSLESSTWLPGSAEKSAWISLSISLV